MDLFISKTNPVTAEHPDFCHLKKGGRNDCVKNLLV